MTPRSSTVARRREPTRGIVQRDGGIAAADRGRRSAIRPFFVGSMYHGMMTLRAARMFDGEEIVALRAQILELVAEISIGLADPD